MQSKKDFVKQYLKPLIIATRGDVKDVYYERRGYVDIGEEYVVIVHTDGCIRDKCVTADSLTAIVRDVMSAL